MKKDFRGTDGTVGFVYAWDGNKRAGKGEQEIKKVVEGERLDSEVRFEKPFEGIAQIRIIIEETVENKTKVSWAMKGTNKFPMNITNLFLNKLLGKDLEISLKALKATLEKQQV